MQVAEIAVAGGAMGLSPMPGRTGDYAGDLAVVLDWRPSLVLTLAETGELFARGAAGRPRSGRMAASRTCSCGR
jgi:hypothetical protein